MRQDGEQDDEEVDAFVAATRARVEGVLLSYVPECADVLSNLRDRHDVPMGAYQLLMEFGSDFLLPELSRQKRASEVIRRVFAAVEELLADDDEAVGEAAYFGAIEPLGSAVHYLSPVDVGPRAAWEISSTYPDWPSPVGAENRQTH